MKKRNILLFGIIGMMLASCGEATSTGSSSSSSSSSTSSSTTSSSSSSGSSSSSSTSTSTSTSVEPATITGVSVNPSAKQTMHIGESMYIKATVSGTGDFNKYVTWEASVGGFVSFDEHQNNTYVTALNKGTVTLKAVSNQDATKSASVDIEVLDPTVDGITLSKTGSVTLENHDTFKINASVTGKGSYNKNVSWSVSPSGIISVPSSSTSGTNITVTAVAPGDVVLTATSQGDETKKASINVHVEPDFDLSLPMTYKKVTSASDLVVGERYIIVSKTADKALGVEYSLKKPRAIDVERDTVDPTLINKVVGNTVRTVKLVNGATSGSLAFLYGTEYLQSDGSNDLPKSTTLNSATSWNISINGDDTKIESVDSYSSQKVYLKHNGSLFGSYKSSSAVSEVELYKYYSGKEQITFDQDEITLSTNYEKSVSVVVHGFAPTTFNWSSDNSSVATVSGTTTTGLIHTTSIEGTANITCAASDGIITRYATIKVETKNYVYDQLDEGAYIIASGTNYIIPSSGSDGSNVDITDVNNYFTFTKAFVGDNTFFVQNSSLRYLKCNKPSQARISLTTDPTVWTVKADGVGQFTLSTVVETSTWYLKRITGSNPWIVTNEESNKVSLKAMPSFDHMEVDDSGLLQKTFNYDETFKPNGLKVYAVYASSLGDEYVDVTSQVTWDNAYQTSSIYGHVTVAGASRQVEVTGLTITHFDVQSIVVDSSTAVKDYVAGDPVDTAGLSVTAHYVDSVTSASKDVSIDIKDCTVSPSVIQASTTEITVTYQGKSDSYSINVESNRFELATYITAGMKVVFTSNNCEMVGDGFNSESYVSNPHGKAVFLVEGTYGSWVFKLVEAEEAYSANIGKYLALDGSGKSLLKLVSSPASETEFSVQINDGYYDMYAYTGNTVGLNQDSYKFNANPNAINYDIEIYREK